MPDLFGKSERFDIWIRNHDPDCDIHDVLVSMDSLDIRLSVQRTPKNKFVLVAQTTDGSPIAVLPAGTNVIGIMVP